MNEIQHCRLQAISRRHVMLWHYRQQRRRGKSAIYAFHYAKAVADGASEDAIFDATIDYHRPIDSPWEDNEHLAFVCATKLLAKLWGCKPHHVGFSVNDGAQLWQICCGSLAGRHKILANSFGEACDWARRQLAK